MLSKVNTCYFVGTLVEIKNKKEGSYTSKDGNEVPYVSVDIVVKSTIPYNGEQIEVTNELRNFTNKFTKSGTVNANYNTICNIEDLLNKRVIVSGASLDGTRFWSARTNQLVPSTKYNFNIIRAAKPTDEDTATFSFSGFVYKPLTERTNADGDVEYYQMSVAQANYKEDNMFVVDFIVDKDNLKATLKRFDWEVIEINNSRTEDPVTYKETELEKSGLDISQFFTNAVRTISQLRDYANNMRYLERDYNKKILDVRHYKRDINTKLNAIQLQRLEQFEIQLERERYECKSNRMIAEVFLSDLTRLENINYVEVVKNIKNSEYVPEIFSYEMLDGIVGKVKQTDLHNGGDNK